MSTDSDGPVKGGQVAKVAKEAAQNLNLEDTSVSVNQATTSTDGTQVKGTVVHVAGLNDEGQAAEHTIFFADSDKKKRIK